MLKSRDSGTSKWRQKAEQDSTKERALWYAGTNLPPEDNRLVNSTTAGTRSTLFPTAYPITPPTDEHSRNIFWIKYYDPTQIFPPYRQGYHNSAKCLDEIHTHSLYYILAGAMQPYWRKKGAQFNGNDFNKPILTLPKVLIMNNLEGCYTCQVQRFCPWHCPIQSFLNVLVED